MVPSEVDMDKPLTFPSQAFTINNTPIIISALPAIKFIPLLTSELINSVTLPAMYA